jgi:hypothetical protein
MHRLIPACQTPSLRAPINPARNPRPSSPLARTSSFTTASHLALLLAKPLALRLAQCCPFCLSPRVRAAIASTAAHSLHCHLPAPLLLLAVAFASALAPPPERRCRPPLRHLMCVPRDPPASPMPPASPPAILVPPSRRRPCIAPPTRPPPPVPLPYRCQPFSLRRASPCPLPASSCTALCIP